MSKETALKTINLEFTGSIPHWEMISNPKFEQAVSGIDPYEHPQQSRLAMIKKLDLTIDGAPPTDDPIPHPEEEGESTASEATSAAGKSTAAESGAHAGPGDQSEKRDKVRWGSGTTWSWDHHKFESLDDMWAFDPMKELWTENQKYYFEDIAAVQPFFGQDLDSLTRNINTEYNRQQAVVGDLCLSLFGFYRTLVMWVLMLFDWDLFLQGVALYPDKMGDLLNRFGEMNLTIFKALANIDAPFLYSHDDLCMTTGPICNPEFYRKYVFPWYERFWDILHQGGKKVIYFSDGNIDAIADDIFACGADGIYGEPYTNLEALSKKYGKEKILWGNIDNRILMAGNHEAIRKEVDRCVAYGKDCPGYFMGVTNHLPFNVPVESIQYYFDYSREANKR